MFMTHVRQAALLLVAALARRPSWLDLSVYGSPDQGFPPDQFDEVIDFLMKSEPRNLKSYMGIVHGPAGGQAVSLTQINECNLVVRVYDPESMILQATETYPLLVSFEEGALLTEHPHCVPCIDVTQTKQGSGDTFPGDENARRPYEDAAVNGASAANYLDDKLVRYCLDGTGQYMWHEAHGVAVSGKDSMMGQESTAVQIVSPAVRSPPQEAKPRYRTCTDLVNDPTIAWTDIPRSCFEMMTPEFVVKYSKEKGKSHGAEMTGKGVQLQSKKQGELVVSGELAVSGELTAPGSGSHINPNRFIRMSGSTPTSSKTMAYEMMRARGEKVRSQEAEGTGVETAAAASAAASVARATVSYADHPQLYRFLRKGMPNIEHLLTLMVEEVVVHVSTSRQRGSVSPPGEASRLVLGAWVSGLSRRVGSKLDNTLETSFGWLVYSGALDQMSNIESHETQNHNRGPLFLPSSTAAHAIPFIPRINMYQATYTFPESVGGAMVLGPSRFVGLLSCATRSLAKSSIDLVSVDMEVRGDGTVVYRKDGKSAVISMKLVADTCTVPCELPDVRKSNDLSSEQVEQSGVSRGKDWVLKNLGSAARSILKGLGKADEVVVSLAKKLACKSGYGACDPSESKRPKSGSGPGKETESAPSSESAPDSESGTESESGSSEPGSFYCPNGNFEHGCQPAHCAHLAEQCGQKYHSIRGEMLMTYSGVFPDDYDNNTPGSLEPGSKLPIVKLQRAAVSPVSHLYTREVSGKICFGYVLEVKKSQG